MAIATQSILYLEPIGGIAGDMFLAAMIDLGVSKETLESKLRSLGLEGWRLDVDRQLRHSIVGTHVDVATGDYHTRDNRSHEHRGFRDIEQLIAASGLSTAVKEKAIAVFRNLGEAEAHVHGTSLEAIHFHEVGAVDSIVDICGAVVALELLGWPEVVTLPPPLGSGTVRIAHGVVPVPVPATIQLLKDRPVRFEGQGELTTPTGAALLKTLARFGAPPEMVVEKIGYGVGTKDFADRANVLRASLGRPTAAPEAELWVLECNVDDCSPELIGALTEMLMRQGALDVWTTPVIMKKGRPGHVLSVLTRHDKTTALTDCILTESTTLGVRRYAVSRVEVDRRIDPVATEWGEVRVKVGLRMGRVVNVAPEFEDCRQVAELAKVPLKEVQAAAVTAWRQLFSRKDA